jgi:Holliday junction resolvasome RuvABC DNA-binding subunit
MTGSSRSSNASVTTHEDAVLALETLGYEHYQILKFMSDLPVHLTRTEEIVKYFLKAS